MIEIDPQEKRPVEVTTTFATGVDTLQEAFAFIMDHIDALGDAPQIVISPVEMVFPTFDEFTGAEGHEHRRFFEVSVSGMVER